MTALALGHARRDSARPECALGQPRGISAPPERLPRAWAAPSPAPMPWSGRREAVHQGYAGRGQPPLSP